MRGPGEKNCVRGLKFIKNLKFQYFLRTNLRSMQLFIFKARLTKIKKLKLERCKTRIRKLEKTGKKRKKRGIVSVKIYMLFL